MPPKFSACRMSTAPLSAVPASRPKISGPSPKRAGSIPGMDGEETPAEREMPLWWQRAERMRREKEQRLRQEAARRLRRIEAEARARLAAELKPLADFTGIVDSDRLAAPFLERIG